LNSVLQQPFHSVFILPGCW